MNLDDAPSLPASVSAGSAAAPSLRRATMLLAYLGLIAFALSPLLWISVPPLVDYPNHLARMSVLLHSGDGTAVNTNYVVHWHVLPDLAMDLVVPMLTHFLPLEWAGKAFLALIMALLVIDTAILHRLLFGRIGAWPLACLVFLYNAVLWFGFVNYLFGLAVALLAFCGWIASARWPLFARLASFAAIAALIFFLHLFAFGVYGLLVASYEAGPLPWRLQSLRERARRCATAFVPFIPSLLLWLSVAGGSRYTAYTGIGSRVFSVLSPCLFNSTLTALDGATFLFAYVLLPLLILTDRLRIAPVMRLPLIAMLIGSALMPDYLSGSWAAHIRLPIALAFVLIGSTNLARLNRVTAGLLASVVILLLSARVWAVTDSWRTMELRLVELRTALQTLPEGSRLLTVQSDLPVDQQYPAGLRRFFESNAATPYWHLPALAVIDRGAFLPTFFTTWTPVDTSERNRGLSRIRGGLLSPAELLARRDSRRFPASAWHVNELGELPCCLDWPQHFDYVLWTDFGQPPQESLLELRPVASGSFFHLYRVVKR